MGGLGSFLSAIAWPIVSRVLASMGMGVISFVGLKAALDSAISSAQNSMLDVLPEVAAILSMSGSITALSIISGALVTSVSMVALKRIGLKSGT